MTENQKQQLPQVSVMDSMGAAAEVWKKNFGAITLLVIFVYLPAFLIISFVTGAVEGVLADDVEQMRMENNISIGIQGFLGMFASLGLINFTFQILNQEEKKSGAVEMLLIGIKRWPGYFYAALFAFLKVLLYTLMLIIPGIYKGVRLSFVDCIAATEDKDFKDTCDKSEALVKGRWWYIFGFLFFLGVVEFSSEFLLAFLLGLSSALFTDNEWMIVVSGVLVKIFTIYFVLVKAAYFFELLKLKGNEVVVEDVIATD